MKLVLLLSVVPALLCANLKRAYVTNSLDNTFSIINTQTETVLSTIDTYPGAFPCGVAVTPDEDKVLIVNTNSDLVTIYDTDGVYQNAVSVGLLPESIAVSPNSRIAYVPNVHSGTVTHINLLTLATTTIPVGSVPRGVTFTSNGEAYVSLFGENKLAVMDVAGQTVSQKISQGSGSRPKKLIASPNKQKVFVGNRSGKSVATHSVADRATEATASFSAAPADFCVSTNGALVYTTQEGSNVISIVNSVTGGIVGTITADEAISLQGIDITPNGRQLWVCDNKGAQVVIIDIPQNDIRYLSVGSGPTQIAVK